MKRNRALDSESLDDLDGDGGPFVFRLLVILSALVVLGCATFDRLWAYHNSFRFLMLFSAADLALGAAIGYSAFWVYRLSGSAPSRGERVRLGTAVALFFVAGTYLNWAIWHSGDAWWSLGAFWNDQFVGLKREWRPRGVATGVVYESSEWWEFFSMCVSSASAGVTTSAVLTGCLVDRHHCKRCQSFFKWRKIETVRFSKVDRFRQALQAASKQPLLSEPYFVAIRGATSDRPSRGVINAQGSVTISVGTCRCPRRIARQQDAGKKWVREEELLDDTATGSAK